MQTVPKEVADLLEERSISRKKGDFKQADLIRDRIKTRGYEVVDEPDGSITIKEINHKATRNPGTGQNVVVFGSGELSSVGRAIHESLIKNVPSPVRIALLETPAGFEDNPHSWYKKLKDMMEKGLTNYHPEVELVPALRKGSEGTDSPVILSPLLTADYIHTGAGSPTYALTHLKESLAIDYMHKRIREGAPLSIASAVAVAFGKYTLPVYEIYFAGHDPNWVSGIDFFSEWSLNMTFMPHWNNKEGGKDIDTRYTYMGEKRLRKLLSMLPGQTTIVGIDEHTAIHFELDKGIATVLGKGSITLIQGINKKEFVTGATLPLETFIDKTP